MEDKGHGPCGKGVSVSTEEVSRARDDTGGPVSTGKEGTIHLRREGT